MDITSTHTMTNDEELSFFKSQIKTFAIAGFLFAALGFLLGFSVFITMAAFASLLGVFLGLAYNNPILGFLSITVLLVLDPMIRGYVLVGGLFRWNTINYWLIVFTIANSKLLLNNLTRHLKAVIAFILLIFIQLAYTNDFENGILSILGIFSIIALYTYVISVKQYNIKLILYYCSLVAGYAGLLTGLIFFRENSFQVYTLSHYYNLGLTIDDMEAINANSFAVTLVAPIMITTVAFSFLKDKRHRFILFILSLGNLILLTFTGSRGALLTGIVSLYFMLTKKTNALKLIFWALIGYYILSMSAPLLENVDSSIARKIYVLFNDDASVSQKTNDRSDIALIGYQMFLENPLGVGTGNFSYTFKKFTMYSFSDLSISQTTKQSHSAFIKIMAENGIFGILLFLLFISTYYYNKKNPIYKNGIYFILAALATFLSSEFQHKPIWFVGAIVAYLSTIKEDELEEKTA